MSWSKQHEHWLAGWTWVLNRPLESALCIPVGQRFGNSQSTLQSLQLCESAHSILAFKKGNLAEEEQGGTVSQQEGEVVQRQNTCAMV